jgi:hypothetical protein
MLQESVDALEDEERRRGTAGALDDGHVAVNRLVRLTTGTSP